MNLLQALAETVLFYHPAVWWLSARIREEREFCADDVAVSCGDALVYSRALGTLELACVWGGNDLFGTRRFDPLDRGNARESSHPVQDQEFRADGSPEAWTLGDPAAIAPRDLPEMATTHCGAKGSNDRAGRDRNAAVFADRLVRQEKPG